MHEQDFRERATRQHVMIENDTHWNTRSDYLPRHLLLDRTRSTAAAYEQERLMRLRALSKLARCRQRTEKAEDRLRELSKAGNLSAIVKDLHACHDKGSFEDKAAALNFIRDLVRHAKNCDESGKPSHGTVYSEETHRIFCLLRKFGGPRTHFALKANIGGPHVSTTEAHWRKHRADFEPGIHAAAFGSIAAILAPFVAKLGLREGERILAEVSIDETGTVAGLNYRQKNDTIIGCCGRHDDADHKCRAVTVTLGDDGSTQG